jgi:tetratricopeptide (TPR) repeat protein
LPATTEVSAATSKAAAVNPEAVTLFKHAQTLLAQNKGPEGREALRKALDIAPDYRDALILLGDNAYENRKYNRAKEAFDKVISLNDRDADSLLKYFKACYYNGEGPQAILRLAEINNSYPNDNSIKFAVAQAYFQLGDMVNAESLCNQILAANPGNFNARDLLERVKKLSR